MSESIAEIDRELAAMRIADKQIVLDGAVDSARYDAASPRILWVLREPNGEGPWDLREYFRETLFTYNRWQSTAALLIRVSYGLLHNCLPWGTWADDARAIADALRGVAVININKRGGDATVDWGRLYRASLDFGPFLVRQVDALAPSIVILAGTFDVLPDAIRQRLVEFDESDLRATRVDNRIFVRAYHTNQRHITHEAYYSRIRDDILRLKPVELLGGQS
jgi:hypothetical protein